jgi:PPOX class probable F420-dependent enzyme
MEKRLAELLDGRYIATLATENADGSTQLTAVWFLHLDGYVYVSTDPKTRKARNARARSRAAFLVDTRGGAVLRGAAAEGTATVLEGQEARAINEQIWRKYLTDAGLADPRVGGAIAASDVVSIRFAPGSWRTWGTDEDFGGAFEEEGLVRPLDT